MKTRVIAASAVSCIACAAGADMSTDEVRALVQEMLADAETRSSLLQGGGSAGWDGGFFIESGDGDFSLKVTGQLQFQYAANWNDSSTADDFDGDFQSRRTKVKFSGKVFSDWGYKISGAFARSTGFEVLEDAYITNRLNDELRLTIGQFKQPFLAENLNSSSRLLGASRSYSNAWFTTARSQGLMLDGGSGRWKWNFAFTDGSGIRSTGRNFGWRNSDLGTNNTDLALTGRLNYLWGEDAEWSQFKDMTSSSDSPYAGRVGAAVQYQQGSDVGGADEQTSLAYTVDAWMEFGGASVQVWAIGTSIEDEGGVAGADSDQYALGIQGGVHVVPDEWELFGRYEYIDFDDSLGAMRDDSLNLVTLGVVNYIHGHSVKWTSQVMIALDEVPSGTTSVALITDNPGEDGQVGFISQIQLLF